MRNLSILLMLITVLFSCTQKKEVDNIVDLTTLTEPDVTNLSELGSEITYIPLETNASFLLSQIDKLIYEGGAWFILGSVKPNNAVRDKNAPPPPPMMPKRSLYRFSNNGEFICQISQQGGGPSEYRFIEEFLYNKGNNTVDIYSQGEIKEFSLDGKWIKNTTLENNEVTSLAYSNNQLLGFVYNGHGQSDYSFILLDENGQVITKYKNKYKFNVSTGAVIINPECIFYQYDGILHCKELNSDTIFSFDNGTFNPKYILQQGEAKYTTAVREKGNSAKLNQFIIQKNFFESENYIFYQYKWKSRNNCFIQNKSNSTQYLIDNEMGLVNDLDNGPSFKIQNTVTIDDNEYLISWINAFELKTHVASDEFKNSTPKHPQKKNEMEQLANRLDENNNPVLMLVKLKQ
ncbi:6-bladed beta-propeller [Maribellus sediminis]|uniref:6-bladed beta-propeller n=1 Tax=Maribellus sediminis TaxID=2696285 RepID=UPI00142F564C|nr:6-bladed beta-propeller [Maribellus sediminis]